MSIIITAPTEIDSDRQFDIAVREMDKEITSVPHTLGIKSPNELIAVISAVMESHEAAYYEGRANTIANKRMKR